MRFVRLLKHLRGDGPKDLAELCEKSAGIMLYQAGLAVDEEDGLKKVHASIESGAATLKLKELIEAQGGDPRVVDDVSLLPQAKYETVIKSKQSGYVSAMKASELGKLAMELGAGRKTIDEAINFAVGINLNAKIGDYVEADEALVTVLHDQEELSDAWLERLFNAYDFSEDKVDVEPVIYKVL